MNKTSYDRTTDLVGRVVYNLLNLIPARGPVKGIAKDLWNAHVEAQQAEEKATGVKDDLPRNKNGKVQKICGICPVIDTVTYNGETFLWCTKLGRKVGKEDLCCIVK